MAITLNKAILHILDFNANLAVFSDSELDIQKESVDTFLIKHIERSLKDPNLQPGSFLENSHFKREMMRYRGGEIDFGALAFDVANVVHTSIKKSDDLQSCDLIVCDFENGDNRMIGILVCNHRTGFTHQVVKRDSQVVNEIINHYTILPSLSQKLDEFAFISIDSGDVRLVEKKRYIDGDEVNVLSSLVLECSSDMSPKDAVRAMSSITRAIAEKHGQNSVMAVSKAKKFIVENAELGESLESTELVREVFPSEIMQAEFIANIKSTGIPETVRIDPTTAVRVSKSHKIKTDTGIEVTFPVEYVHNKDYVEFINNPDGTLSIQIKNIGKITNR